MKTCFIEQRMTGSAERVKNEVLNRSTRDQAVGEEQLPTLAKGVFRFHA